MDRRIHVATGDPISRRGGLHTVVQNLATAQLSLGLNAAVLEKINYPYLLDFLDSRANSKFRILRELRQERNQKNNLLHYHFAQSALMTYPLVFSKKTPHIFHFHGPWSLEGKAQGNSPAKVQLKFLIENLVYRQQSLITTHSDAFRELLISQFDVNRSSVQLVYPGVDLKKFEIRPKDLAREALGLGEHQKIFLCIRRLEPRMGLSLAIDAVEFFPDYTLVIAGTGSLDKSLRNYAASKHYHQRVKFLGPVSEEQHGLVFNAADLVLVPSLSFEGFGLVVWEAFASGVPVVASGIGGLPEALGAFADRLVFKTGSLDDFVSKIEAAIKLNLAPINLRKTVLHRTWENTAIEIETLAEKLLGVERKNG